MSPTAGASAAAVARPAAADAGGSYFAPAASAESDRFLSNRDSARRTRCSTSLPNDRSTPACPPTALDPATVGPWVVSAVTVVTVPTEARAADAPKVERTRYSRTSSCTAVALAVMNSRSLGTSAAATTTQDSAVLPLNSRTSPTRSATGGAHVVNAGGATGVSAQATPSQHRAVMARRPETERMGECSRILSGSGDRRAIRYAFRSRTDCSRELE